MEEATKKKRLLGSIQPDEVLPWPYDTESFANYLCKEIRAFVVPSAASQLAAVIATGVFSPRGSAVAAASTAATTAVELAVVPDTGASGSGNAISDPYGTQVAPGGSQAMDQEEPAAEAAPEAPLVEDWKAKYENCSLVLAGALAHIQRIEESYTPIMEKLVASYEMFSGSGAFLVPAEFSAMAPPKEGDDQQARDRRYSRDAMDRRHWVARLEGQEGGRVPGSSESEDEEVAAPATPAKRSADDVAEEGAAVSAAVPGTPTGSTKETRGHGWDSAIGDPGNAAGEALLITYDTAEAVMANESGVPEDWAKFFTTTMQDSVYQGNTSALNKAGWDVHNKLCIKLMAQLRHGSPIAPAPMWHYFAPLGRISTLIRSHRDFFKYEALSDENILCALSSCTCPASGQVPVPYFQILMVANEKGVKCIFARADPHSKHVSHTINSEGFRIATPAATPWNKKKGSSKGTAAMPASPSRDNSYWTASGTGWWNASPANQQSDGWAHSDPWSASK